MYRDRVDGKRLRCVPSHLDERTSLFSVLQPVLTVSACAGSLHDLLRNEATLFKDPLLRVRIARDIAKGTHTSRQATHDIARTHTHRPPNRNVLSPHVRPADPPSRPDIQEYSP
jgi:hypothetical protein